MSRKQACWHAALALCVGLGAIANHDAFGAEPGKLAGKVTDLRGNAVKEAVVMVSGPCIGNEERLCAAFGEPLKKVLTGPQGEFSLDRLIPGWYLVVVSSPAQLSAVRVISKLVHVATGDSAAADFKLSNLLQFPAVGRGLGNGSLQTLGEDWKWVLRTSKASRPVFRFQDRDPGPDLHPKKEREVFLPPQVLVALMPRETGRQPMAGNRGMTSVLAYFRPLSDNSDFLVAGSVGKPGDRSETSLATTFRRGNFTEGRERQVSVAVHRLNLMGSPGFHSKTDVGLTAARGIRFSYSETRQLLPDLTLTAGLEVDHLDAVQTASTIRPQMELKYRQSQDTTFALRYASQTPAGEITLLEQVGRLNAFPRITLRNFSPQLESLHHVELSVQKNFGGGPSRLEVATYVDRIENAAVLGFGDIEALGFSGGSFLPNPAGKGNMLNAGDFRTSGFRAAYERQLSENFRALVSYALGGALLAGNPGETGTGLDRQVSRDVRSLLRVRRTHVVTGRWMARIRASQTRITTSYQWTSQPVVSQVDPYGQAKAQSEPYLNLSIRHPLPQFSFLPGRVEAIADFRNLLAQGYVPVLQQGEQVLFLVPSYRSFRGGFSLLF